MIVWMTIMVFIVTTALIRWWQIWVTLLLTIIMLTLLAFTWSVTFAWRVLGLHLLLDFFFIVVVLCRNALVFKFSNILLE